MTDLITADKLAPGAILVRSYTVSTEPEPIRRLRTVEAVHPFTQDGKPMIALSLAGGFVLTVKPSHPVTVQTSEWSAAA
jgi:hypothetical protein